MEAEPIDEPTKPGQYLAYEREKKGLTIEDVSRELRLSTHILLALEEEAYDKLPELVYVRGYIRLYCRLLRIDPVPVLNMYTENLPKEEDQLLEDLSPSSPVNERQQRLIMILGSVAVVSIFLILIVSWWQENQQTTGYLNEFPVSREDNATQSGIKDTGISEPSPKQAATQLAPEVEAVPAEPSLLPLLEPIEIKIKKVDQEDGSADNTAPTTEFNVQGTAEEGGKAGESPPDVSSPEAVKVPDSNAVADPEFTNRQIGETDNIPKLVTLVVMASGESWARVRDGSGDIFIHRILPKDYNKIFMVNLPLKFELGNAKQVNIMIEGRDYDFSPYIKPNRVATFEVSELP